MTKNLTNNQLLMKECIQQEFNDSSFEIESTFFEYFTISEILKNFNLSDDEINEGLTGGGNDGGCDGLYVFLNGELVKVDQVSTLTAPKGSCLNFVIIQAKNTISFGEDAIMKFKTISENLLPLANSLEDYKTRYNERTLEIFQLFRDSLTKLIRSQIKIKFSYFCVSLANEVHPNVLQQADELKQIVAQAYPASTIEVNFIGANELMAMYNTTIETNINLSLSDPPIALGEKNDYVALVNLGVYYNFITDSNGMLRKMLFESNVRDYQGKNSVNSSIAETLANKSNEDFWWLNNGVTILASKAAPITNRELQLENPKIVNGLQTTNEIFNYFSRDLTLLKEEKRNILIRVIVPINEESRDNIIFATNNQTSIPKSSLRVTDNIHLQIELYFKNRGLYYDRRKNYYKNLKKKSKDIISVSFLAQCLISTIMKKPDFARARPSTLLTDDSAYHFLYEENQNLDVYYKLAVLGKRVQLNLTNTVDLSPAEKSDILFYLLYAVVAKTLNSNDITFKKLENFNIDDIQEDMINNCKNIIFEKYKEMGGNGRVAKSKNFINEIDILLGF